MSFRPRVFPRYYSMRATGWAALALVLLPAGASAQIGGPLYIQSSAGNTVYDRLPPRETPLIQPQSVWINPESGDVYIADGNFVVRRVRGNLTEIVAGGGGVVDDSIPVRGREASFDFPAGLAGNSTALYITDVRHHRIRRLNADGTVQTVIGKGTSGFSGDGGPGSFAELANPTAIVLSAGGNLYIADSGNYRIRRYDTRTQIITTIAGTGEYGQSGDGGAATAANLGTVRALALDAQGNLYFGQVVRNDHGTIIDARIRRIATDGRVDTYAGSGEPGFAGDGGNAKQARIADCFGLAVNTQGDLFVADTTNGRVRIVTTGGTINTYAGKERPYNPGVEGVPATSASLHGPTGIAVDARGNLYIPEANADLVRRVDAQSRIITTVAGTLNPFDGAGNAATAPLIRPTSIASDKNGNLYIADNGHYRVRRIDRNGGISTVAGDGKQTGNTGATANSLGSDLAISIDPQGRLLIADRYNALVRRVNLQTLEMTTVVNLKEFDSQPSAVVADEIGNLYISDWYNDIVWFWDGQKAYRLAGTGHTGFGDDGINAYDSELNSPEGLLLDRNNGLIFCDSGNHRIRRVDLATFNITTIAGDGIDNSDYDGYEATLASVRTPVALALDAAGNLYFADSGSHEIRVIDTNGIIQTVGGSGSSGFAGDGGPAVLSRFDEPDGLAFINGDLYVCDSSNYRVRRIFRRIVPNNLRVDPGQFTFRGPAGGDPPSPQFLILNSSVLGLNLAYTLGGGTDSGGQWLWAWTLEGETPDANIISVVTDGLPPGTYTAKIIASAPGSPDITIPVELILDPPNEVSSVTLSSDFLPVTLPQNTQDARSIQLTSPGKTLNWSIRMLTSSPWLVFSSNAGTSPTTVNAVVDATGLTPGTYVAVGYFVTDIGGSTIFVVTATVTEPKPALTLDRESIVVEATEGSTSALPQPVGVFNTGSAAMDWDLAIPASATWIRANLTGGRIEPGGKPAAVQLFVDPSGLREGVYQANLMVRAAGAVGAPKTIPVRLKVAKGSARPVFDQTSFVFAGAPGVKVAEQTITLSSTGGALAFSADVATRTGGSWLTVTPRNGAVLSSSDRHQAQIEVRTTGLAEDVYSGTITYTFSDGSVQQVTVQLIARSGAASSPGRYSRKRGPRPESRGNPADCGASRQVVSLPTVASNFSYQAGWPVPLRVQVVDDCGKVSLSSTVTANFSNGDPAVVLSNLRNGTYAGTWTPAASATSVTLSVRAVHPELPVLELKTTGRIGRGSGTPPVLSSGGVMNAASRRNSALVAPGGMLVLKGANFPTSAADATVVIGGQAAQVLESTAEEMRVLAPSDFGDQSRASVLVTARGYSTAPETVSIVPADPGLWALAEGVAPAPGQTLTVSATGLGAVDGDRKVVMPVTAKLGDAEVTVEAAVATDAPGMYQIRIVIPAGASGTLPLTVAQNGLVSNAIPIALP